MILNNILLLRIFALLTLDDWLSLQFTCKLFHKLANTESLLQSWCIDKYPAYITANIPLPSGCDWAWMCKCLSVLTDLQSYASGPTYSHLLTEKFLFIGHGIGNTRIGIRVDIIQFACRTPRLEYHIGTFVKLRLQGHGTLIKETYTYTGPFIDGETCGIGIVSYPNGDVYQGQFANCRNRRIGFGTYTWTNGTYYKGTWYNQWPHGNGEYCWIEGNTYRGQFKDGLRHGQGTFITKDAQEYSGLWHNNVPVHCKFGWCYYECKRCRVKVCQDCKVSKHEQCNTKIIWTVVKERELSCGHVKEAMTGDDPSAS